jgi:hypothetical protein
VLTINMRMTTMETSLTRTFCLTPYGTGLFTIRRKTIGKLKSGKGWLISGKTDTIIKQIIQT